MNIQQLKEQLRQTPDTLDNIISAFTPATFNQTTTASAWTAGQVADHLIKACNMTALLEGNVKPTDRDPDALSEDIAGLFLNFDIKMEAPDFIVPGSGPFDPQQSSRALNNIWLALRHKADELDLSLLCLDFELPGTGALTRQEWLSFGIVHTQRHIRQLRNIAAELRVSLPSAS